MKLVSFILFLYLLNVYCLDLNDWNGRYSDSEASGGYGGSLYICYDEDTNRVYGAYSQIGIIYGEGDTSETDTEGNTLYKIKGQWLAAGAVNDELCKEGTFELTLNQDGQGFTGIWRCIQDSSVGSNWIEWRIDNAIPSDQQCAYLHETNIPQGSWELNENEDFTLDICYHNDGFYTASGDIAKLLGDVETSFEIFGDDEDEDEEQEVEYFSRGKMYIDDRIISGTLFSKYFNAISLGFVLRDGSLGYFVWLLDSDNQLIPFTYNSDIIHTYEIYNNVDDNPSNSDCKENNDISFIQYFTIEASSSSFLSPLNFFFLFSFVFFLIFVNTFYSPFF
eukprot:TRINITY_DN112_c0_g1_i4.p1 TRINITY_DN112_c0_g1~~TRINITY_DN112_c0_g1_i4.p1  ORF type:complete len:335 (+),score=108.44 TRINITY_DN112_c0_g1_i4:76-1080(+)